MWVTPSDRIPRRETLIHRHLLSRFSKAIKFVKLSTILAALAVVVMGFGRAYGQEAKDQGTPPKTVSASLISTMEVLNNVHKLSAGDRLSFRVIEDEDSPQLLAITDAGEMEVPHIGRVVAAGKTCKALAYEIKNVFEKEYYYKATVIMGLDVMAGRIISRGKVYVMGQVGAQGPQEIPADEKYTVSQAILRAGGFAQYANKRKVKHIHRDAQGAATETKIVDLVEIMERGKTEKDPIVEPEDVIIVPEKWFNFQ